MSNKKLVFITEARFFCDSNNMIYFDRDFDATLWDRYLEYFDELVVFARIKNVNRDYIDTLIVNKNARVKFIKLPYFIGLFDFLKNIFLLNRVLKKELYLLKDYSFILRVPGSIGFNVAKILNKFKINYSVEVVGDPAEVFAQGNFTHNLRPLLRFMAIYQLKYVVENAKSVLYVTQSVLQKKYPASVGALSFGVSDVRIEDNIITIKPKNYYFKKKYQIISVGSLAQMYKSPDVLLKAIHIINSEYNDIEINLTWLGEGIYKEKMINLAKELDVFDYIDFKGNVSREEVMWQIDSSDLFVLASKTEGLPRVIVEAMAKGLPIIATNVGGIPELLPPEVLVEPNNAKLLAEKIYQILSDSEFYNRQSSSNLINSHNFKKTILDQKRKNFFDTVMSL